MDLQLGLALSSFSDKGFDLNCSESEIRSHIVGNEQCNIKKRDFLDAFEDKNADDVPQTLPLLVWENQEINKDADHVPGVVGWPPINSWRKKICQHNRRGCAVNCVAVENGGGGAGAGSRGKNSMFVKVKMEGVGIARKVDLGLHHSHHTLLHTLAGMFGKCQQSMESFQLTFEDKEGGWQLAEDVNWGSFIRSVQRLKLVRRRD